MADPSEPQTGTEGSAPSPHAPPALRRRVLAGVGANPGGRASRGPAPRRLALVAGLLAAGAAAFVISPGGARRSGHAPAGRTSTVLVRFGGRAELRLAGLAQPPAGEVYELWLAHAGGAPQPTNVLFTPTSAGTASVLVPQTLHGVRRITVTAEPLGGSTHPTSRVIVSVAVGGA